MRVAAVGTLAIAHTVVALLGRIHHAIAARAQGNICLAVRSAGAGRTVVFPVVALLAEAGLYGFVAAIRRRQAARGARGFAVGGRAVAVA